MLVSKATQRVNFRRDEAQWRRKALLWFVIFGTLSDFSASIVFILGHRKWLGFEQFAFSFVGAVLAWAIFKSRKSSGFFARITAILFVANVAGYLMLTGGMGDGEGLLHFTLFPTLFIYFLGGVTGTVWSVGALLFVLIPVLIFWLDPRLPVLDAMGGHRQLAVASIFFIYFTQLVLNLIFERNRMRRINDLEELNSELESRLQVQVRLEQEREVMSRQVLHASKLAAIGELASAVAHEINNPLMIACENNEMLRSGLVGLGAFPPEFMRLSEYQSVALDRIRRIVGSLRNFSRMDGTSETVFDSHAAIQESVALVQEIYSRQGLMIVTELEAKQHRVRGNAGRFNQVVVNLLSNARDAILSIGGRKADPRIVVATRNEGDNRVLISVTDNGCGIPDSIAKKIFDPFFTTKDPGRGTGLGLSLSSAIIAEMKGDLRLETAVGSGSTFTVSLPLEFSETDTRRTPVVPEKAEVPAPRSAASREAVLLKDMKILIVEDEEMIADLLRVAISTRGARCEVFSSAEAAIERLPGECFHAVVSDMNLPGMSGRDFLGQLSGIAQGDPRKILISGNVALDGEELRSAGITLLLKPFEVDQLVRLLELEEEPV